LRPLELKFQRGRPNEKLIYSKQILSFIRILVKAQSFPVTADMPWSVIVLSVMANDRPSNTPINLDGIEEQPFKNKISATLLTYFFNRVTNHIAQWLDAEGR